MSYTRRLAALGLATLASIAVGCAAAPLNKPIEGGPVDTGSGTLASARAYLEGRWSLVSYEVFPPGKDPVKLNGSGTLTYDTHSNLDVQIRVDPQTGEALERVGIINNRGVISTTGRTVVDMQNHTLTYVIEGQRGSMNNADAGPLAMNRKRYWDVQGNILTLTTKSDDGKPLSVGRWEKEAPIKN